MEAIGVILFVIFVLGRAFLETLRKRKSSENRGAPESPAPSIPLDLDTDKNEKQYQEPKEDNIEPEGKNYKKFLDDTANKNYKTAAKELQKTEQYTADKNQKVNLKFTKNEVKKGIIMSEILQEPRSKRPFIPQNYYKRRTGKR